MARRDVTVSALGRRRRRSVRRLHAVRMGRGHLGPALWQAAAREANGGAHDGGRAVGTGTRRPTAPCGPSCRRDSISRCRATRRTSSQPCSTQRGPTIRIGACSRSGLIRRVWCSRGARTTARRTSSEPALSSLGSRSDDAARPHGVPSRRHPREGGPREHGGQPGRPVPRCSITGSSSGRGGCRSH